MVFDLHEGEDGEGEGQEGRMLANNFLVENLSDNLINQENIS